MTQAAGLGLHAETLASTAPHELVLFSQLLLCFRILHVLACLFSKLAILSMYLRILTNRYARGACYALCGVMILYTTIIFIFNMVLCIPLAASRDPSVADARCLGHHAFSTYSSIHALYTYSSIPNVVVDGFMLLLPVRTVIGLKLALRDRIGLLAIFTAGSLWVEPASHSLPFLTKKYRGTIAAIARIVVFVDSQDPADTTWAGVPLTIVTLVEIGMYLIPACIPGIRPLYLYLRRKGQFVHRGAHLDVNENARMGEDSSRWYRLVSTEISDQSKASANLLDTETKQSSK